MMIGKKGPFGLFLLLVLAISVFFSGCGDTASAEITQATSASPETEASRQRQDLETILVMGLDKYERPEKLEGYVNNTQSDFMLLVVVDKENRSIRSLHINRDTMTTITRLGVFGGAAGKYTAQIALAHAYGSGGSDSALNAVKAVSNFLGGVKIDHYMTFTMDSVGIVNDMVGGVTVLVEDDFSELDPTLVQGQEITLRGDQALHFVRGRTNVADGTNLNRMARQRQYMTKLFDELLTQSAQDEAFLEKLVKKLSDSFDTDMSVYQLDSLFQVVSGCTMEPILTIDGENIRGAFMEFYADPDSVQRALGQLFR